jgi:hypothetical protein
MRAVIRGLAVPTGQVRWIGDRLEVIEHDAFSSAVNSGRRIDVRVGGHEAWRPLLGAADVFLGREGLYFDVAFPLSQFGAAGALDGAVSGGQVSVGLKNFETSWQQLNGERVQTVHRADFDHLALVARGDAAYAATSFWRADPDALLDQAPYEIREMDRRWRVARAVRAPARLAIRSEFARVEAAWRNIAAGRPI